MSSSIQIDITRTMLNEISVRVVTANGPIAFKGSLKECFLILQEMVALTPAEVPFKKEELSDDQN